MPSCQSGQVVEFRFALRAASSALSLRSLARPPREQRINDGTEDDQINQCTRGDGEKCRASPPDIPRLWEDVRRYQNRPRIKVEECADQPVWRMTGQIEPVDQEQYHCVGDHNQKADRD